MSTGLRIVCAALLSSFAWAAQPVVAQKTFVMPEAAAEALITAAEKFDVAVLKEILGPEGVDLVVTDDPVLDKNQAAAFAAPAACRVTGVRTFIVNHTGNVYQKDLGPSTVDQFRAMERYNPDKTWTPVENP